MSESAARDLTLGPFVLGSPLGRGATARVWSGRHAESGTPVAIKVASSPDPNALAPLFAREVRLLASLTHPGVVTIHDHGRVEQATADRSARELERGAPYLVMELAELGTLKDLLAGSPAPDYETARSLLLPVLDALAHAHARGVLHRDVKPANILVTRNSAGLATLKVTDFGIARAAGEAQGAKQAMGTPSYMAPEQVANDERRQGAWTDLYATGCLAWRLVCGRPPFYRAATLAETMMAQLTRDPPEFEPAFPVPNGLEEWIRTMLTKSPAARFRRAADAGAALIGLGGAPPPEELRPAERILRPALFTLTLDSHAATGLDHDAGPAGWGHEVSSRAPLAPFPRDWRGVDARERVSMAGVGLGLYLLREIPMIGREHERDGLWTALRGVFHNRRASVISLVGPAGSGKTRLAQWLTRRADETGAATVLSATHEATPQRGTGWRPMLDRELQTAGSDPGEPLLVRIREHLAGLEGGDSPALVNALARICTTAPPTVTVVEQDDSHAVVRHFFSVLSQDRPLVVWLDDVQWGLDSLRLVETLMSSAQDLPVLFVLTARADLLAERPREAEVLARLGETMGAEHIRVGPLDEAERVELVDWLLGLEPEVAADVAKRCAGHPLFAVQLVGDWVNRGLLAPSAGGFRLRPGSRPELPDDIHAVWDRRIERLEELFGEDAREALELGAVLGLDVDDEELAEACARSDVTLAPELLDRLFETGLGVAHRGGWSFTHGMLRESLERSANQRGRAHSHHQTCAGIVDDAEREGLHLLAAELHERAVGPLLVAVEERLSACDLARTRSLLDRLVHAMDHASIPESDDRRVTAGLHTARLDVLVGHIDHAHEVLSGVEAMCTDRPDIEYLRARLEQVRQSSDRSSLDHALRAAEGFAGAGARLDEAYARVLASSGAIDEGDLQSAETQAKLARVVFEELGEPIGLGRVLRQLARVAQRAGDFELARELTSEALRALTGAGHPMELALCHVSSGEIARVSGRFDVALQQYGRAKTIFRRVGSRYGALPTFNMALTAFDRGDVAEARARLTESAEISRGIGRLEASLTFGWLAVAAGEQDWPTFDRRMKQLQTWTFADQTNDDFVCLAKHAFELAKRAGETERAAAAHALASLHEDRLVSPNRDAPAGSSAEQ